MREKVIKEIVTQEFAPTHMQLINNSHNHSGHRQETHFQLLLVSKKFEGMNRVQRQRLVNQLLNDEFANGLHALSLRLLTPSEWELQKDKDFIDPLCHTKATKA